MGSSGTMGATGSTVVVVTGGAAGDDAGSSTSSTAAEGAAAVVVAVAPGVPDGVALGAADDEARVTTEVDVD